jgi:hypothetical protein
MKINALMLMPIFCGLMVGQAKADKPTWIYLSSATGNLPPPNTGRQQTACLVLDIDRDKTTDFVITERTESPSVVWYKYQGRHRWKKYVIETQRLRIEAGGDFYDIDGDGDLDIVFCGDASEDGVWWWENPFPHYEAQTAWKRHLIKSGDQARYQHDCRFGDFDGDGQVEFAWWSQTARQLFLAEIPAAPREAKSWPYRSIFQCPGRGYEGMDVADMNGDGKMDIVGAGLWFEHKPPDQFQPHLIAERPNTKTAVGHLIRGSRIPQVVLSPGDSDGPLEWYEWDGVRWKAHRLLDKVIHGHSLQVADIDGDGNLDIFVGEMGKPGAGPQCRTLIFWGDGRGSFTEQRIAVGKAHHESKLADLNGDGRLDILGKPYSFEAPMLHIWLQKRGE